ncbi:hypothetical protein Ciccas_011030 [Cichlidogyrus casuarinus]|uniref:Uncharacterized protein n=1 Tax=Cichlidogyrus casuarinus TaxID=1844966 RepID=A0ABD2PVB7_9PLAT
MTAANERQLVIRQLFLRQDWENCTHSRKHAMTVTLLGVLIFVTGLVTGQDYSPCSITEGNSVDATVCHLDTIFSQQGIDTKDAELALLSQNDLFGLQQGRLFARISLDRELLLLKGRCAGQGEFSGFYDDDKCLHFCKRVLVLCCGVSS